MLVAGVLIPDWYMQFVRGKKPKKPVSILNGETLLPFSWIQESFASAGYFCFEAQLGLPRRSCGKDLGVSGLPGLDQLGLGPRAVGSEPFPEQGLQPHLRTTVKCQLCKHPLHHLRSGSHHIPCLSAPLAWRKWEYLAYTRCTPQGMSAVFHLLLGAAKARDGGERWMEIICCEANHSRRTEPLGAALPHLCSFGILATMESPGRAQRSCCSCVLEWPPVVRSDLECKWAKSHPVMLTLMKRRRSRNRSGYEKWSRTSVSSGGSCGSRRNHWST